MPRFIVRGQDREPEIKVYINQDGKGQVNLNVKAEQLDQIVATLTTRGTLRLWILDKAWAERNNIQTDENGCILTE